ncbi:MAG TPA: EamA family transporter [Stellaceae bacterium]|nr:EamA family transporter [Stellaceae bacterium]
MVAPSTTAAARHKATLVGALALLLWSALSLLTTMAGPIPPFQLVSMTFLVGGLAGLATWGRQTPRILGDLLRHPGVWPVGVGGLFGYHFLYFLALGHAPAVEATLLNYLWPLLIVLFSGLLPGERLRWWHIAGTLIGLAGLVFMVLARPNGQISGTGLTLDPRYIPGYAAALGAAVFWASYSVISRRFAAVPTEAVAAFCLATSFLACLCHLAFEHTVWPASPTAWGAVLALGLGPVGLAFYAWDHGVKRGNITTLGGLSYATPLMSTLLLILAGRADATPAIAVACCAIVGGALLAARDLWQRKAPEAALPESGPT